MSDPLFEPMPMPTGAAPRFFNTGGVAIRGYDPVAYFLGLGPTEGSQEFSSDYLGFTFLHSNAEHQRIFQSEPERYAPQFGGYCAFAMSKGAVATTVPPAWNVEDVATVPPTHEIHGDLLYLNYSLPVRYAWRADIEGNVARAHSHWPQALVSYGPPRS